MGRKAGKVSGQEKTHKILYIKTVPQVQFLASCSESDKTEHKRARPAKKH